MPGSDIRISPAAAAVAMHTEHTIQPKPCGGIVFHNQAMPLKRKLKYQLRLFLTAFVCIWAVIIIFAWLVYRQEKELRVESVVGRVNLANGNVIDAHELGRDVQPYLDFIDRYLDDTYLREMSIMVYDTQTRRRLYEIGKIRDDIPMDARQAERQVLPDGSKVVRIIDTRSGPDRQRLFLYSSRISPDGKIEIRSYVPHSAEIDRVLSIDTGLWLMILGVGVVGTILAYIITRHQAKNVSLLHDFARRAASDRDFIPMGDFPADEIGDISRQIVAIYNSRMQANVRREREHIIALKATEEKNHMKRVLTDNISHELKTPIGIIRAYVDMLLNQPDMPEQDRRHFLEKTQSNVERLVSMLNDLSTMTRLEESSGNIPLKEIDFHSLVFNIADEIETSHILGDMDFRYNIPMDCVVLGNEGLLTGALQNLIKNSKAYSQGTQVGIELLGRAEGYYTFSFYDNGVGVSEEHMPHLFDRFYRVDSGRSRKAGGTGLGLPIVKSSINTMGGSISVRQRRGGGLEFVFTLPRPKKNGAKPSGGNPDKK